MMVCFLFQINTSITCLLLHSEWECFYYFHYTIALKCGFVYNLIISAFSLFWKFCKPCQLHIFSSGSICGLPITRWPTWGFICWILFAEVQKLFATVTFCFLFTFSMFIFSMCATEVFFVVASFTFKFFCVIFMFYFSVWFVMVCFYVCLHEWLVIVFSRHLQVCVLCICVGVSEFSYS